MLKLPCGGLTFNGVQFSGVQGDCFRGGPRTAASLLTVPVQLAHLSPVLVISYERLVRGSHPVAWGNKIMLALWLRGIATGLF